MAANGLSSARASCADSEEVSGAATRPNECSNGVNDDLKEAEEDGDDAYVCLRDKSGSLGFFLKERKDCSQPEYYGSIRELRCCTGLREQGLELARTGDKR